MWDWWRKRKAEKFTKMQCPKCGGTEFQEGPRGGAGQNFRCRCGAEILAGPMGIELISGMDEEE
jgi:hypothetical protein